MSPNVAYALSMFGAWICVVNLPSVMLFALAMDALPQKLSQAQHIKWMQEILPNRTSRYLFLEIMFIIHLGINAILNGVSARYRESDPALASSLFKASALLLLCGNFLYSIVYILYTITLVRVLRETSGPDASPVVEANIRKVINNMTQAGLRLLFFGVLVPVMAFYEPFFTNLMLSKAVCTILMIMTPFAIYLALVGVIIV